MTNVRTPVSFWLQPAEPARATFGQIIDALAQEHGAPRFSPHITLYACTAELSALGEPLQALARSVQPLRLRVREVSETADYFKTVFLRIEPSPALIALQRQVSALLTAPQDYHFEPHLSLIYQQLPAAARQRVVEHVSAAESFECDALAAVVPGARGWTAVEDWRIIQHCRLGT